MPTDDTTSSILDAAELLFAKQGYDATSIREITRHAGVNVAAVNYHFGDKPALLRAVTDRIVTPLNQRRFHLLDLAQARAEPAPPDLEAVLDAFIRPDVETMQCLSQRGPTVARFLGRIYSDQTPWIQAMAAEQFGPAGQRFAAALAPSVELGPDELAWRMNQIVAVILHTFATWPADGLDDAGAARMLARLVAVCSGILEAPSAD